MANSESSGNSDPGNRLTAGTGRSDITPAPGTPQGGWGAQTHQRGVGAVMPLYATALVLKSGPTQVAIVDIDSIGFDLEWTNKIIEAVRKLTGVPRDHIRVSCTHTHSGPNTFRLPIITEGLDMVLSYMESLPLRIAGAVWEAQQNQTPVRVGAGTGSCEINVNRRAKMPDGRIFVGRNWQGAVDNTVRVVRIDDLNEKPVATILHYACHPTIMAWENKFCTPDYPGPARKVIEEALGGSCLFLQGAAGNIGPRRGFTGDVRVFIRAGTILGLEGAKVATEIESLPRRERLLGTLESGAGIALYEDEPMEPGQPRLMSRSRMIQLPIRSFVAPEVIEAEAAERRKELEVVRTRGNEAEVRAATAKATQAGIRADQAKHYHGRTHVDWELQCICIGPIALLSIPGEPFTEINEQIVAASPFAHTLFSGYSNGGFGYLPVACAFEQGGYEVNASPFTPEAAAVVVNEGLKLLREMAKA